MRDVTVSNELVVGGEDLIMRKGRMPRLWGIERSLYGENEEKAVNEE